MNNPIWKDTIRYLTGINRNFCINSLQSLLDRKALSSTTHSVKADQVLLSQTLLYA
ncbi:hypothetical protein [Azospirillum largimobile]